MTRRTPSAPAIQNIPLRTAEGRALAEALRRRLAVFDFDYATLELRIQAELAREQDPAP